MSTNITNPAAKAPVAYDIDTAHTEAQFKVRHMMISYVRGAFRKVSGTAALDLESPANSSIEVAIDVNSVETREPDRDKHLRSADFFDVANHPTMTFRSSQITAKGGHRYEMTGNLTLRGTTKPVTLEVETTPEIKDPWGNLRLGATATGKINRKDFGLNFNLPLEGGGVLVGDNVDIAIETELVRRAAQATGS